MGKDSSKAWSHSGATCVFQARGFTLGELGACRFASTIFQNLSSVLPIFRICKSY